MARYVWATAALLLVSLCGCGGSTEATVSGTVTADGELLKEGLIRFEPTDPKLRPVDAPITDGKYTVAVAPGEAKVSIRANKVTGKAKMYDTPDSPVVETVVEAIDPQFNDKSTLKVTVTPGQQTKDWDVKKRK